MSTVQSVAATRVASWYMARELRSTTTGSRSSTRVSLLVCMPVTGASSVPARGCPTGEVRHRNGLRKARWTSILRRFVEARDLELAQLLHQRRATQAQQARGLRHHAIGAVQRLADQRFLD